MSALEYIGLKHLESSAKRATPASLEHLRLGLIRFYNCKAFIEKNTAHHVIAFGVSLQVLL